MELEDNAIDVSEFFLVEYSADSEKDSATGTASKSSPEPCDGLGNDDAESCTCDSSSNDCLGCDTAEDAIASSSTRLNGTGCSKNRQPEPGVLGFVSEGEDGGGEEEEEREETVWEEDDGGLRKEEMDAMEDRLFWETCMAVGYPMN